MDDARKGYAVIQDGAEELPVYFDNEALALAERVMKKSVFAVLSGFETGQSGIAECAHLIAVGASHARSRLRLPGGRMTQNQALKLMDRVPYTKVAPIVFGAIAEIITDDSDEAIDAEFDDADSKN